MKKNKLFFALLAFACTSFYACSSSDDEVNESGNEPGVETGDITAGSRFMSVQIINPAGTKADGGEYEAGSDVENNVNSLRFYFFDAEGNPITVNATAAAGGNKNFVDAQNITPAGANMDNVEKILKATVVINTKQGDNVNVKKVVAVANHGVAELGNEAKSLDDLCQTVGNYSTISKTEDDKTVGNFLMTSSSYADEKGQVTAVNIEPGHLCNTEAAAEANPVNIYIERVVAKATMKTDWNTDMATQSVSFNDQTVTAVSLGKVTIGGEEKDLYVVFDKWDLTSTAQQSYLIKKVGSTTAWSTIFIGWNDPNWFRSYWALNPKAVTNTSLERFNYNEIAKEFGKDAYCLENAGNDTENGTKSEYVPTTAVTNRTQAIIAATLVTVENGAATAVGLVNFGGAYYAEDNAVATILGFLPTKVYTDVDNKTEIAASDVKFVTATTADAADALTETSPRYLSYLQLASTDDDTKKYYDGEGKELTKDAVNTILKSLPGTKVWHEGKTYYYTDIEHLGTGATTGKYGVVRNHVYKINLKSVKGLGTPVLNPEEDIVPQKPENVDTYIAAQINILSWRIVKQDVSLEW